ncbi:Pyridoxal phosphate-dependent decarboxylase [Kalmanozyma brasiliensis GHG001]|uniref:Pyridoxal phosphate-dependent decarboxylase n=1 Tax=Kalmanozyma brasiliensis (strain GHG001) TaxID=1365824 RepID=UPI001CE787FB|nr:Pyridoxal phosphate-dependent decarboxylase [Kalmanozyma brasiliensis GHG001]EST07375.2 Pyridoxal phosphate-dependent decarboxylase [Kalmanozyma brasiliensis GHG001]
MDIEGFRKAGYAAVDRICDYYSSLSTLPVSAQVQPGFLSSSIPSHPPIAGEPWSTIDNEYHTTIMPGITHWQHPNFYGYFPCNASFEGCIADLYCASISNPGFNWSVSPSVTELEILMVDWVGRMLGLDESFLSTSEGGKGGGVILGSASEVALTVAIAARERCIGLLAEEYPMPTPSAPEMNGTARTEDQSLDAEQDIATSTQTAAQMGESSTLTASTRLAQWRGQLTSRLVMYGTTQTHSIAAKAALILGLDFRALPVSAPDYSLDGATLQRAIDEDTALGRVPFLLIATIGTTSSGAVDNLTSLLPMIQAHPTMWLHIDAAYAGVCLSLPELRESMHLDAINSGKGVDSFSTNLHKWGLVQFDCSPLLVRDRGDLSRALTVTPAYLRTKHGDAGDVLDLRNLQISLGRRFRSLKIWFVLRSFGIQGFQAHLRRTIELAGVFEQRLREEGEGLFEIVAPPRWALVVFRIKPPASEAGGEGERSDALNRAFWEDLQELSDKFVLTQTTLPGVGFCVRFVVGSPQTRSEHVEATWELVKGTARRTWARFSGEGTA